MKCHCASSAAARSASVPKRGLVSTLASLPNSPRASHSAWLLAAALLGLMGVTAESAMATRLSQLPELPPEESGSPPPPPADATPADATEIPPGDRVPSIEIEGLPNPSYPETPGAIVPEFDVEFDRYRLGPGDAIFVSVQRFPDLSFQATLDIAGNIILPIEGAIELEGLTLEEATAKIRATYNKYVVIRELQSGYTGPNDVTLTLTAQRGVEVTILGEVERPGFYPLPEARVSTALLIAGGATDTADLRSLTVQRRLPNNRIVEESVDLYTPLKDGGALPDLRLENGDVVIVPRVDPSDLNNYDRTLVSRSTLAQPEITVRFINYSNSETARGGSQLGALTIANGSTFIDALTQLNVSPDRANLGAVGLVRFDPETGRAIPVALNASAGFRGDPTQNPPLRDNDVIIVGRNLLSRLAYVLDTITQPFQDVLSFLLFFDGIFDTDTF